MANITKAKVNKMLPYLLAIPIKSLRIFLFEKRACLNTCLYISKYAIQMLLLTSGESSYIIRPSLTEGCRVRLCTVVSLKCGKTESINLNTQEFEL